MLCAVLLFAIDGICDVLAVVVCLVSVVWCVLHVVAVMFAVLVLLRFDVCCVVLFVLLLVVRR